MKISGVILSGGVSKRFQGDKAFAMVDGELMVRRVAKALFSAVGDVWVSVKDERRGEMLAKACEPYVAGFVVDQYAAGPLSGLLTAAEKIEADAYLSCSNDVPWIRGETLEKIAKLFKQQLPSALSVVWADGSVETLIQTVQRSTVADYRRNLLSGRERLLRPSDILRSSEKLLLVYGGNVTQDPYEFSNINTSEDLTHPKPRGVYRGLVKENIILNPSQHFAKAVQHYLGGKVFEAGLEYFSESVNFLGHGVFHLAEHAASDALKMFEAAGSNEASSVASRFHRSVRSLMGMR
ncbi:MAG: molybdenum cofactor guanylyltransferase [Candidatus Caldarchaeum sp.]|nr:molybdenum cofactor guanylyltransferase [Candidatus Caldarchaeum sp.]